MKTLDANRININSPYKVWTEGDVVHFVTDYGIQYAVDFDYDGNPYYTAYWLNLTNESSKPSPSDKKIPQTVISIVEEFFDKNPDVLLYMCSTAKEQQAQRARLFLRWFNGAEQQKKYVIKAAEVKSVGPDGETRSEYVALIVPCVHPLLDEIVERFDEEIQMFNDNKPID